jgi:hypothetical protein
MQRLPVLEHDIVCDINDGVDRPHSSGEKAVPKPGGRWANRDIVDHGRAVSKAKVRRQDLNLRCLPDIRTLFGIGQVGEMERLFSEGSHLAGDP